VKKRIYWLGSQWMVTGHGIETVKGNFHIQIAQIWERDIEGRGWPERLEKMDWVQIEDFCEALNVARKRWPERSANDADTFYFDNLNEK
jgi:hypothetical protein